jgi:outer membrane protein OmpA-like peptidoglycan-associated protein
MANNAGTWSDPAFYTMGSASFGLQAGLEQTEVVMLIMSDRALQSITRGQFKFGAAELPDEAKLAIDQMVGQLQADKKAVWIEIEGHTDSVGGTQQNQRLGLQRAEAVKRYLHEQHQVSLHKINTLSYGEGKPAADNKTRDGRAQNRRVVIKVLA